MIAGSSQPNEEGTAVKISSFKIHENYVNINVTYDAVLVQVNIESIFLKYYQVHIPLSFKRIWNFPTQSHQQF